MLHCLRKDFHVALSKDESLLKTPRLVQWSSPPSSWKKMNADGSSFGNPGKSGAGGVIRDWLGRWVVGFSLHVGKTTKMENY